MDRFEDVKLRVKEATDLVSLIEGFLPLKPRGRLLLALCPFHPEKSPSFTVYPDSQHYYCFGCQKHGDVFTFLMEHQGLTFPEAMQTLAERANISIEGVFGRDRAPERRGPDPHQVLAEVAAAFAAELHGPAGQAARDYLQGRGLLEAAEPWVLGFHRPGALLQLARQRRLPSGVLEEAGLLRNGREPFAGRLMFPIEDERGKVCAFGGRILPGAPGTEPDAEFKPAKYVNSPESPFFHKRSVLYGLHRVKRAGVRRLVVVEGYTDVIACHLAGFPGAVAALGTAFTSEHARKIERYASEGVVLLFDGDRAGLQAAERALREVIDSRLPVRIAMLTDGKDPGDVLVPRPGEDDDLVVERRARFADLLDGAEEALTAWFRLLRRRLDFTAAAQFEAAARECATLLQHVESDLRRTAVLQQMARHLAIPPEQLQRLVKPKAQPLRARAAGADGPPQPGAGGRPGARPDGSGGAPAGAGADAAPAAPPKPRSPAERAEIDLLACVLTQPHLAAAVGGETFASREVGELLAMVDDAVALGRTDGPAVQRYAFTRCGERQDLGAVLAAACARATTIPDASAFLAELQRGRQRLRGRAEARTLRQRLQAALDAGDRVEADLLTRELVDQLRRQTPRGESL